MSNDDIEWLNSSVPGTYMIEETNTNQYTRPNDIDISKSEHPIGFGDIMDWLEYSIGNWTGNLDGGEEWIFKIKLIEPNGHVEK